MIGSHFTVTEQASTRKKWAAGSSGFVSDIIAVRVSGSYVKLTGTAVFYKYGHTKKTLDVPEYKRTAFKVAVSGHYSSLDLDSVSTVPLINVCFSNVNPSMLSNQLIPAWLKSVVLNGKVKIDGPEGLVTPYSSDHVGWNNIVTCMYRGGRTGSQAYKSLVRSEDLLSPVIIAKRMVDIVNIRKARRLKQTLDYLRQGRASNDVKKHNEMTKRVCLLCATTPRVFTKDIIDQISLRSIRVMIEPYLSANQS